MKTPSNAVKINFNGSLGQGEVFSFGFYVSSSVAFTNTSFAAANLAFAGDMTSGPILSLKSFIDSAAAYNEIRSYSYGPTANQAAQFVASTALAGQAGTGTGSNPLQTSAVCSLRSPLLTSRGRGRVYLPITGVALVNHELSSVGVQTLNTAINQAMAAAVTRFGGGLPGSVPVVYSPTAGATYTIVQSIVDSRTDVQRRRAGKQTVLFKNTLAFP